MIIFISVPILELYLFLHVGAMIGVGPTIGLVILTGIVGSWMVRQQGLKTLSLIQQDLSSGKLPTQRLLSGLLIIIGGVLLITPGMATDVVGFMLMVPGNRRLIISYISKYFQQRINDGTIQQSFFYTDKHKDIDMP
jgi:UPF0716 protein FxsA